MADRGTQDWRTLIVRDDAVSRLFLKRSSGRFDGTPDIWWDRPLSDAEVAALLDSPFSILKKDEVNHD